MAKCPNNRDEFIADEKCAECGQNTKCLEKLISDKHCDLNFRGPICLSATCNDENRNICDKVAEIRDALTNCKLFSNPGMKNLNKCLECPYASFTKCEQANLVTKNLLLTFSEAQEIIEEQLEGMLREFEGCFGKFAFDEKDCWKNCEFKVGCLRHSKIIPTSKCIYFPITDKNIKETPAPSELCDKCTFQKKFCKPLIDEKLKEVKLKLEATKAFNKFYTLDEIRANFIINVEEE